jgi:Acetoacetate decarboxylase (ADC)
MTTVTTKDGVQIFYKDWGQKAAQPIFLIKIIAHVDGTARVCELVRFHLEDITVKGTWTEPAALELRPHALAPVADLPVLQVLSAKHVVADLTLGTVVRSASDSRTHSRAKKSAARAEELASQVIDKRMPADALSKERKLRKQRLLKGKP